MIQFKIIYLSLPHTGRMILNDDGKTYDVAVKIEPSNKQSLLKREEKALRQLGAYVPDSYLAGYECIPKMYYFREKFMIGNLETNIMFMQLLGRTLEDYRQTGHKFSLREMLIAGIRLVTLLVIQPTLRVSFRDNSLMKSHFCSRQNV